MGMMAWMELWVDRLLGVSPLQGNTRERGRLLVLESGGLASGAGNLGDGEDWVARRGRELGAAFYRPGRGMQPGMCGQPRHCT